MRSSIVITCTLHLSLAVAAALVVGCADAPQAEPESATTSHLAASDFDGRCGSSNIQFLPQRPTAGLCAAGTPTAVSGGDSGPWDWSCPGSGSGSLAHCSALSTNVRIDNPTRDLHGTLIKPVYAGIFGAPPVDYVYFYWVDRYNLDAGVNCRAIAQAFVLAYPGRAAAAAAVTPTDSALTGYIEMLYKAILPSYPGDNTALIAGWRTSGLLTMDQLDGIFLDDNIFKGRCEAAGMF